MADDMSGGGGGVLSVLQNGVKAINNLATTVGRIFPAASGTAASAVAGSATLPANPVGFIVVTLPNGTSAKVPYYG